MFFDDNFINTNYKNYVDSLYINIELYGDKSIDNLINNIPLNSLLGIKKALIHNDIKNIKLNTIINIIHILMIY